MISFDPFLFPERLIAMGKGNNSQKNDKKTKKPKAEKPKAAAKK
jgi:hypothetical protein